MDFRFTPEQDDAAELRVIERALELQPGAPALWQKRALAHLRMHDPESAEADASRALEFDATRALSWRVRGMARRARETLASSLADLKARLFLNWLAHGDPAGHRDVLADVFRRWTSEGYHIQHFNALRSLLHGDLYEGEIDRAEQRFAEQQASLEGSMLLRVQLVRGETHQLKAMIGLARFAAGKVPSSRKRAAHKAITKAIKALAGEGEPWCLALADLLRAGQAKQQGDDDGARNYLLQSIADLRAADMALHAACAERALGLLEGGDKGAARVAAADSWMRDQAIQDPARITQAMAPGLTEPV